MRWSAVIPILLSIAFFVAMALTARRPRHVKDPADIERHASERGDASHER